MFTLVRQYFIPVFPWHCLYCQRQQPPRSHWQPLSQLPPWFESEWCAVRQRITCYGTVTHELLLFLPSTLLAVSLFLAVFLWCRNKMMRAAPCRVVTQSFWARTKRQLPPQKCPSRFLQRLTLLVMRGKRHLRITAPSLCCVTLPRSQDIFTRHIHKYTLIDIVWHRSTWRAASVTASSWHTARLFHEQCFVEEIAGFFDTNSIDGFQRKLNIRYGWCVK